MARKTYSSGGGRRRRHVALLACFLLSALGASGLEKTIELGRDALWADMMSLGGVVALPGRWGFHDLALAGGQYAVDPATEMLFHFDSPATADATGAYTIPGNGPLISSAQNAVGTASAAFTGARQGVGVRGNASSLFAPGTAWPDFTIEFWLYPVTLSDGEEVLGWTGSDKDPSSGLVPQQIRCFIRDRQLVWDFSNVFKLPGAARIPVSLHGVRQLLPRTWHHHLLRFDSRLGVLEYRLDDVPEAIVHVSDTGREGGSIAVPVIGATYSGPLVLGAGFTGFLEELRLSRRFVDDSVNSRFLGRSGVATSRIIDLGFSSTRVIRIDTVDSRPADSGIELSYQVADAWNGRKVLKSDTDWVPFVPGTDFGDTVKARYIQLRVEMYPDGTRTRSPRLSSLRVVYEPNPPPSPPAGLMATAGNGKVTLSWRKVNDLSVKGYLVFYGPSPRNYLGSGAVAGPSPLDAGSSTTMVIDGLDNGSLYYFAVVSYDDSQPRQQSEFSAEVSARPSRIYQ